MSSIEPANQVRKQVPSFAYGIDDQSTEQLDSKGYGGTEKDTVIPVSEIPSFQIKSGSNYIGVEKSPDNVSAFKGLQVTKQTSLKQPLVKRQEYQEKPKEVNKRKMLTKQNFESDMHLQQTGRFEENKNNKNGVSKSANQNKETSNLGIHQSSPDGPVKDFTANDEQENEMRETSYFKAQVTEEEQNKQGDQSIPSTISIENQQKQLSVPMEIQTIKLEQITKAVNIEGSSGKKSNHSQEDGSGIHLFKLSSKSQMKHRAYRKGQQDCENELSLKLQSKSQEKSINSENTKSITSIRNVKSKSSPPTNILKSQQYQNTQLEKLSENEPSSGIRVVDSEDEIMKQSDNNKIESPPNAIKSHELIEIRKISQQMEKNENITGNFGKLTIQKQQTENNQNNNYSELKGEIAQSTPDGQQPEQKMFTSMSDIGFNPVGMKKKKLEIITSDQIQRMMDTQNNWRVRTKTIDEMLKDVKDKIETDPNYIINASEKILDFFTQLLTDQNFKIVLNTLNILNMVIGMKEQQSRKDSLGLSNLTLGRHIPQIVKKLADSKNIIRQEANMCLFGMFEIMKSGTKKDNNFIALILPYLNNSSNWHIREELLNLLMKCFLTADSQQFDSYQILDSILQLFNDQKEKIRNLALEAVAAFASIGFRNKIVEIMYNNNVEKDICELITSRFDYGMYPVLNQDGMLDIPYQDQYDMDSVAHSMANQSQSANQYHENSRRKQSISGTSNASFTHHPRGNSSGRKIIVATANAGNQHLGVSHQDEIMQQAYIQSKRTASANNPNQFEFDPANFINNANDPNFMQENNFSNSIRGSTNQKNYRPQFDEFHQDINGSNFLPQLQKVNYPLENQSMGRMIGSSGGMNTNLQPNMMAEPRSQHIVVSGGNKRSLKYLHGTPGHPNNHQTHFSQNDGKNGSQYVRGNSGKSPSLFSNSNNTHFLDMSAQSHFGPPIIDNQMSELPVNDFGDRLSTGGINTRGQIHQTPQQYVNYQNDQSNGPIDFTHQGVIPLENIGVSSPMVADRRSQFINEGEDQQYTNVIQNNLSKLSSQKGTRGSNVHTREGSLGGIMPNQMMQIVKKQQGTFYSDGTSFTGITATTGATSSIKGKNLSNKNQIVEVQNPAIIGPIKATRQAFDMQTQPQQQDLCIDNRKKSGSQNPNMLKIKTKVQSSQGTKQQLLRENSNDSDLGNHNYPASALPSEQDVINSHNRSFSYSKNQPNQSHVSTNREKELLSAGVPQRSSGYFGHNTKEMQNDEDPALMTQSSKIVYVSTDDLEVLGNPQKEYKKCLNNKSGIYSHDWADQFEACNIIRRVCKYHQSIILQNGNILQSLISTLIKLADSLRSAVSRIALMTFSDMFAILKRVMEPFLNLIVKVLIKKGTDTNHFIADEADKCLQSMIQNCQEAKVLQILLLQTPNSRSNPQRLKMCQQLQNLVKQLGNNILFFKENDKLLVQLAKYLQDASQDVRQVAKMAFIAMSQSIMGHNDLEKLLQRVLSDVQYKKVHEFLDKEPMHMIGHNGSQIDFVITNANNSQQPSNKRMGKQQASLKTLRYGNGKKNPANGDNEPLNIQAKSILNPSNNKESSGFLNKIALQNKSQPRNSPPSDSEGDHLFIGSIKEIIVKAQTTDWRQRLEAQELLFELLRAHAQSVNNLALIEIAECISKLINDQNAKIQIAVLENMQKTFPMIIKFILKHLQSIYKSAISNLGLTNVGVRKNSEQLIKMIYEIQGDKFVLVQVLLNMIQYNSNARLKPALIDQMVELIEHIEGKDLKIILPMSYKLLDDNNGHVKQRTEKLFKKLYSMGQEVIDSCPQSKLQRVCDICLGGKQIPLNGTGSSGKNSSGYGTGNFGANGNSVHLNSRC